MADRTFKAGDTSKGIDLFIGDSSVTTGAGLSGVAYNTAGLKCYYRKGITGTATAITLINCAPSFTYQSAQFCEIDATNMKGVYRFDIPDTLLASAPNTTLFFSGAANMRPVMFELEIAASSGASIIPAGWVGSVGSATISLYFTSLLNGAPATLTGGSVFVVDTGISFGSYSVSLWTDIASIIGLNRIDIASPGGGLIPGFDYVVAVTGSIGGVPIGGTGGRYLMVGSYSLGNKSPSTDEIWNYSFGGDSTGNSVLNTIPNGLRNRPIRNNGFDFPFFMVSSADHVTPKTGATVTAQRSLDAGAFANCAGPVTEIGSGWYNASLFSTDANGFSIALKFTAPGADPVNVTIIPPS